MKSYLAQHPEVGASKLDTLPASPVVSVKRPLGATYLETLEMLKKKMSITQIVAARELGGSTIEGHIARLIEEGEEIDHRDYVTDAEERTVANLVTEHGIEALKPIYEAAGEKIGYGKIKIAIAGLGLG